MVKEGWHRVSRLRGQHGDAGMQGAWFSGGNRSVRGASGENKRPASLGRELLLLSGNKDA